MTFALSDSWNIELSHHNIYDNINKQHLQVSHVAYTQVLNRAYISATPSPHCWHLLTGGVLGVYLYYHRGYSKSMFNVSQIGVIYIWIDVR